MIEDMTVRNLSPATQRSYLAAVSKLSRYFGQSPDCLELEDIRAFQVHLVAIGISWPALNQIVCALRFFYGVTLGHDASPERISYARQPNKLPVVLGADEVVRFREAIPSLKSRTALTTVYAAGLRVSEVVLLKIADIDRALYNNSWLLSTKVNRAPWEAFGPANPDPLNNQVFRLYDLSKNFNQSEDIAAQHPDEVAEMRKMFVEEAKKYQVFPMDASVAARIAAPRPSLTAGLSELVYTRPMTSIPQGDAPYLFDTSYTLTADITVPEGGAEGMIATSGGRFAGWGFYLLKGKPVFLWNLLDLERIKWEAPDTLSPGRHTVEFDFKYDGLGLGTMAYNSFSGVGKGGTGTLKVDGKAVDTKPMEKTIPMILQWDESFDIGADTITGVNDNDYVPPFPLTEKFNKLTIKIDRPQLSPADIKKLEAAMRAASDGPVGEDLTLVQKVEMQFDKREECRKQADTKKLDAVERIGFVRECMK